MLPIDKKKTKNNPFGQVTDRDGHKKKNESQKPK